MSKETKKALELIQEEYDERYQKITKKLKFMSK